MQYLHVSKKEKNLEYLANEMFKAAGEDVQRDTLRGSGNSVEGFEKVVQKFVEKTGVEDEAQQKVIKDYLNKELPDKYNELKKTLKEVRVFGVGKNPMEKLEAVYNMGCRTAAVAGGVAVALGSFAMSMLAAETQNKGISNVMKGDIRDAAADFYVGNIEDKNAKDLANVAGSWLEQGVRVTDKLSGIRSAIKKNLKGETKKYDVDSIMRNQLPITYLGKVEAPGIDNLTSKSLSTKKMYKGNAR